MNRRTPRRLSLAAVAAAALALGLGLAAATASGAARVTTSMALSQTSVNWAGYAITSSETKRTFSTVSGQWVQPAVDCSHSATPSFAAFWVGLGGFNPGSRALEQVGTQASCDSTGAADYSVWWEIVPQPSVTVPLAVEPGDTIAASVTVKLHAVTLAIRDLTRGTSFRKQVQMLAPDLSSAEWIAEAPAACSVTGGCRVVPLANFGSVSFSSTLTRSLGRRGTILDFSWDPTSIALQGDSSQTDASQPTVSAVPSAVSSDGRSFSVSWQQTQPQTPAPPATGSPPPTP